MMLCFAPQYLASVGLSNADIAGYWHDAGQPTVHFNVLKNAGEDPRRVIVDERAPVYYVGTAESYPPMRFIVSDDDLFARYEQTMMMLRAMEHFGYQRVDSQVMHGTHCAYIGAMAEGGEPLAGRMIFDFLRHTDERWMQG